MKVPMVDLKADVHSHREEYLAALTSVLDSTQFINGPEVQDFEKEAASYLGVKHTVGMNSGTDALTLGLLALGVKRGDEVITSTFSFFATAESICQMGATPVFVDIDPTSYALCAKQVEQKITDRTKAILPVHLFGQCAEMEPLWAIADRHNLCILEDAAQVFGASYQNKKAGSLGTAAAFSFYPSKNLGAFGDGGLLATDSDEVATHARMLRNHGSISKKGFEFLGFNSRLDSFQAAILRCRLRRLDAMNQARHQAASRYDSLLQAIPSVTPPQQFENRSHIFHQYVVRLNNVDRNAVFEALRKEDINVMVYYSTLLPHTPALNLGGSFPIAEQATREVLALPIYPDITAEAQQFVVDVLAKACQSSAL